MVREASGDLEHSGARAVPAERINAWFNIASKESFNEDNWEVAARLPEATLSHRSGGLFCGHLIKFDMTDIFVEGAPERPCNLLVRPEVRGRYADGQTQMSLRWLRTIAPGDSIVERASTLWVLRIASLLFGNSAGPFRNSFFYDPAPIAARHQLRRDFPEPGDCAYACFQDYHGIGQEGLMVCRHLGRSRFRTSMIFSTPEDKWPSWASPFFGFLTDMVRKAIVRFLNRPGVQELRQIDENLYVVLCMRSFNRGPPLVPLTQGTQADAADAVIISAGKNLNLTRWTRFNQGKFRMAEYMRCFMGALDHEVSIYDSLDGRNLVPYQCVVLRSQWMPLRASFFEAFHLQKAAYRRANGGTTAPGIIEDARPHMLRGDRADGAVVSSDSDQLLADSSKFVVRNTFLELDDVPDPCPMKRSKSDSGDLSTTFSV